jgi:hypothetical protein
MSKKIGRNDPCPCGSGKKYKYCHFKTSSKEKSTQESSPLADFDQKFLLDTLCTALLMPENHGKNIRLELLICASLLNGKIINGKKDSTLLKKVLDQHYNYNHLEDPPVNLFTEVVTFHGGDYLILPGIMDSGTFILSNLLTSIFQTQNNLPKAYSDSVYGAATLLLAISNKVLTEIGLDRYQDETLTDDKINILEGDKLKDFSSFLFVPYNFLLHLSYVNNIKAGEIIRLFTLIEEDESSLKDEHNPPVVEKPFMEIENGYYLLCPSTILSALTHHIISAAIKENCLPEVISKYCDVLWYNVNGHFRLMGYSPLKNFKLEECITFRKDIYRFDTDKIAITYLRFDDGADYSTNGVHQSRHSGIEKDGVDADLIKTINTIKEEFPNNEILVIILLAGIGREYMCTYPATLDVKIVAFPIYAFEIIMRTRDYEPLMIWNYITAKEILRKKTRVFPLQEEIDLYAFYKDHDDSFYMSDNERPGFFMTEVGYSTTFIRNILKKEDIHSVLYPDVEKGIGYIPCVKMPWAPKIYSPITQVGIKLTHVLEGYQQPIWVEFNGDIFSIDPSKRRIYIEYLDAISYWLWQINPGTRDYLILLGKKPMIIKFDFDDRNRFENLEVNVKREPNIEAKFVQHIEDNCITLIIPHEILPYLYGTDNEGERLLVKKILLCFGEMQAQNGMEISLTEDVIDSIISTYAPLGLKKKLFLINLETDFRLDPRGLSDIRYVLPFNTNLILDFLVDDLISIGEIDGKPQIISDKRKFIVSLVGKVLLPRLMAEIERFEVYYLLKYLLQQNETLIQKRRGILLETPTRIACFVSVEEQIHSVNENLHDVDKVALCIRCLIEHVAACPGKGKIIPSQSTIDNMVALMKQIISWGMIGDQITYKLFDVKIEILPSKRIGVDKTLEKEFFDPFSISHAKEEVTNAIDDFDDKFKEPEYDPDKKVPENIEVAFIDEFGISLTRMIDFTLALVHLGFTTNPSTTIMDEQALFIELQKILQDLSKEEFSRLVNHFSLESRESIIIPPEGYKPFDIFPWRYDRRLSLLRKPLVKYFDKDKNSNVYLWGPRQAKVSCNQILYLLYSGKLRAKEGGKLGTLLGSMLNAKGKKFANKVFEFLSNNNSNLVLDKEVPIRPGVSLHSNVDLGDIDVLVILKAEKIVILIECKKVEVAKNMKQIIDEVDKLVGSDSKKGWIAKHHRRYVWVEKNRNLISKKYNIDITSFKIISIVLTSEDLISKYIKKETLPFKMMSFYQLKENGLDALINDNS